MKGPAFELEHVAGSLMLTVAIPIPLPEEEVPLEQATIPTPASNRLVNKTRRAQKLLAIGSLRNAASALLKPPFSYFFLTKTERTLARPNLNKSPANQCIPAEKNAG